MILLPISPQIRLQILFNDSDLERVSFIKRPTVIPAQFVAWCLALICDELENGVVPPCSTGFILLFFVRNSSLSTYRPGKHFKACPVHVIVW